jgi:2-succinyl-5-enolpyruvyl-6-hydroxy-3-cyclohexene-1-carboxylate synthase
VTSGDVSLRCAWSLVDELVRGSVRHACLSPGSRSTPLALALARHPAIELQVHLDERSSAFAALGIARASARPVIAACTSGTAAAEFLPAVVEASMSRVPLVLLTADRPPRLRGTGANQTIDQVDLYGSYAEYLEPPVPEDDRDAEAWGAAGREAVAVLRRTWQPVQVNCPFDEPLTPLPDAPPPASETGPWEELVPESLSAGDADRLTTEISGARGVVVVGGTWPIVASDVDLGVVERLGWPVLAEPISNLRRPGALTAAQALIGADAWLAGHRPEVVLQLGATPTSRATQSFVASAERLIVADRAHPDPDPERRATWRLPVDGPAVIGGLSERDIAQRTAEGSVGIAIAAKSDRAASEVQIGARVPKAIEPAPEGWLASWRSADRRARDAIDLTMDGWEEPSEPRVARDVAAAVPDDGTLLVGNSTPIRDLDLTMRPRDRIQVIANRGASGIDGLVSTAVGIASVSRGPTVALLGDLSTLYDLGAIAWNAARIDVHLTVVVVNNGGGEIFSALPQRDLPEHRRLFVTPHEVDLPAVCAALGIDHIRIDRAADLPGALAGTSVRALRIVEVVTSPERDRARRRQLREAVAAALA